MSRRIAMAVSGVVCAAALAGGAAVVPSALAASATPSPGSKPSPGQLTVSISGLPKHAAIALGGSPLTFVVTVRNETRQIERNITPVVAIDHCTCESTPVEMAPNGMLRELDNATGKWRPVFYDKVGGGMDYLGVIEQPPFTLKPGATARFTFRLWFAAKSRQLVKVHSGRTGILVSVVHIPLNWNKLRILASTETPVAVIVH